MKSVVEVVEFEVPRKEATDLGGGSWVWELSAWRGVREISLDATMALACGGDAVLTVHATPMGLKRVRRYCKEQGYKELTEELPQEDLSE